MYVYIKSETNPDLFTVGCYKPDGKWEAESDHRDSSKAAQRVAWLNGGDLDLTDGIPLSNFDRQNVGYILTNSGAADWFGANLLRLIKRADTYQRENIRRIYPDHVAAVELWEKGGNPVPTDDDADDALAVTERPERFDVDAQHG